MSQEENAADGIGRRLRRLLALRGETIKSLSDRTGIPYRTLHNHVGGSAKPNADQLALLVKAGIDANYLLTGLLTVENSLVKLVLRQDENLYFAENDDVLESIHQRAIALVDEIILTPAEGEHVTFKKVIGLYQLTVLGLADVLKASEQLIVEARQKGVSLKKFIGPVMNVTTGLFMRDLIDIHERSLAAPESNSETSEQAKPTMKRRSRR